MSSMVVNAIVQESLRLDASLSRVARPYSAQGRYRLQYKRPAWKRVWNTSQCSLGFHTCKCVDF